MNWHAQIKAQIGGLRLDVDIAGDQDPIAVIGPNGSGKSTLLRVLAGAHRPIEAHISVDGRVLASTSAAVDVPSEGRRFGYVPQGYGLFPHLDVLDNVAFGLSVGERRLGRTERRTVAMRALEELDCAPLAHRRPTQLSGGERQRIALARALVVEPAMLLLDEPLAALDVAVRRSTRDFLAARLRELARPSIVVTHDLRDVLALDAEVVVIEQGRVIQRGTVDHLRDAPASDFVAEFVLV